MNFYIYIKLKVFFYYKKYNKMVLSDTICYVKHIYDIINIFWDNKNEQEEIFLELLDNNFCEYKYSKGNKKGKLCLKKIRKSYNGLPPLCHTHNYQLNKMKCKYLSCDKYRKKGSTFCPFHYNKYDNSDILFFEDKKVDEKTSSLDDNNKQMVLYNKNRNIYLFNKNIYMYLDTKYDKIYEFIKYIYNRDSSNIINLIEKKENNLVKYFDLNKKFKKYKDNKKKRLRKKNKILKEKNKPHINIKEIIIDSKKLNNKTLIENTNGINISIKIWPLDYENYKEILNLEIIYFHCYINREKEDKPKVLLFYKKDNNFSNIIITYKELYNILIKEYNSKSVYDFIIYYYNNFIIYQN